MVRLKTILKIGQSNSEGMAPFDEVADADFNRWTGENKPGSFAGYDKTITGIKVWTPRMPRAGTAITATGGTLSTLVYTTGPAVTLNQFQNTWVVRTGGATPGVARFCSGNNAAGGGGVVTLSFDRDWDTAPTTETFNITQGGCQGAGFDYLSNPSAAWIYEGSFRDLRIRYLTGSDFLYLDGYDYTNLHGAPIITPALNLSFRWAGPMFEHTWQMKREIPAGEDLWVVMMPLPYSYLSPFQGVLLPILNLEFAHIRTARTNDWSPYSSNPAANPATFDLYHLFVEYVCKTAIPAWIAANRPGDLLDVIEVQIALGESESLETWRALAAGANMRYLRDTMRTALAVANLTTLPAYRIPWVLNGMDTDATAYPGGVIVNPQYQALADEPGSNTAYVHTDDQPARIIDPLHFQAGDPGYVRIGAREVDAWRSILYKDSQRSAFASSFDVLRPIWGVSAGGGFIRITGDYAYLQTQPASQRLWIGAYLLRDPGPDRIPVYLGNGRREVRNTIDSGFVVDEFLGYALLNPRTGTIQVGSLNQGGAAPPPATKSTRSTTSAMPLVLGYIYGNGIYSDPFIEVDYTTQDSGEITDVSSPTHRLKINHQSGQVGRWQVTHPGLVLTDYDILLRGYGYAKSLGTTAILEEGVVAGVPTNEHRKHTIGQDYRSEIQTGNRENYPQLSLGRLSRPAVLMMRWVPLEWSPNGRAEETTLTRFVGNHGALKQQPAVWHESINGANLQFRWRGITNAHRITATFENLIAALSSTSRYSNGAGVWLRRLFDKAYTWTPATNTMTDLAWAPGTNRRWEVTRTERREYDPAGTLIATVASPFTNGFGAVVWRATGTHYGVNTDLTVAIYSRVGESGGPNTMRISNYNDGSGDVGGYAAYDQFNAYCHLRCDADAVAPSSRRAYSYHLVIGSFAEVQAALVLLYGLLADHVPDSDITPFPQ